MEIILSRYRNLTVLLALILGQLLLLAWQVKGGQDARLIRIWAVTAVTPLAKATDWARGGTGSFLDNYIDLRHAADENKQLRAEIGQLRLQNHFLQSQLQVADRAKALLVFQSQSPSKTLPARVIATGTGMNSRAVYVDRGTASGVMKGMAVIRPEGIVGKVVAAYPTASLVMLMTEQGFAAGVISQKNRVRGTLRGEGAANCTIDYIRNEQKVELGEQFFTTGDDRIFPKGLPAGMAVSVKEGRYGKEVILQPFALRGGVEEVLVVLDGVHVDIPPPDHPGAPGVKVLAAPPPEADVAGPEAGTPSEPAEAESAEPALNTEADRLMDRYRRVGEAQGLVIGQTKGRVPDFTKPPPPKTAKPPAVPGSEGQSTTPGQQAPSGPADGGAAQPPNPPTAAPVKPAAIKPAALKQEGTPKQ